MKHKTALLILVLSLFLTSCLATTPATAPAPAPTEVLSETSPRPIQITDALGRAVSLEAPPQRIAITGKALIMILDAAYAFPEAQNRISAVGNTTQGDINFISLIDQDFPDKLLLEQSAGAEQIASVHPDLVILKSSLAETLGQPLEAVGIPVVFVDFETPEQYARDLHILGQIFQNEARAQELTAYYQDHIDQIKEKLEGITEKPRTLLLYYKESDGTAAFNVPPLNWMQTRLVEMAGGDPVWGSANPGKGWTKVSLEQIAAWDADQILIISYSKAPSTVVAALQADPQWQSLRAVKENHLAAFPGDLYSWDQPDVRWILGLSWLAERLHPDRFPDLDMAAQAQDFYQQLYGIDSASFQQNILPTIRDIP